MTGLPPSWSGFLPMILSWGQDIRWIAPPGTSIVGAGEDVDVGMGPWWLPVRAHHHIPSRGIAPRIPSFVVLLRCIGYLKCIGAYPRPGATIYKGDYPWALSWMAWMLRHMTGNMLIINWLLAL